MTLTQLNRVEHAGATEWNLTLTAAECRELEKEIKKRKNLSELQAWIGDWGQRKGWRTPETDSDLRNIPELIALMHSELSEALEEFREFHSPQEVYYSRDKQGEAKPEGVGIELADCIIRILHFGNIYGLDLEGLVVQKMNYNETRPARHGGKAI